MFPSRYLQRYSSYALIEPFEKPPARRTSSIHLWLAGLLLGSVVLNIFYAVTRSHGLPSPLDDYQQLKRHPLVNASSVPPLSEEAWRGAAVVTTLYSDSYAPAVATLGHSLRLVNTSARLVVLYLPSQVSLEALCLATSSGFEPHPIERIPPPADGRGMNKHFVDQYTKLALWSLDSLPDPITSLVYIDSDTLVLRNFDELFALPYAFAATPDVWVKHGFTLAFNAGVLFVRPDSAVYADLRRALAVARFPPEFAEQAFLNQFFATDAVRLPLAYNANLAIKQRAPAVWDALRAEARVLHYTVAKPFVAHSWRRVPLERIDVRVRDAAGENGGLFREEMMLWGEMWRETRRAYAQNIERCLG